MTTSIHSASRVRKRPEFTYTEASESSGRLRFRLAKAMFVILGLLAALPAFARTITITAEDCDQIACLSAEAPRLSWAMVHAGSGVFNGQPRLHWSGKMTLLMRFPITDIVPKGQRITKAELTIMPDYLAGSAAHLHIRRAVAEWGTGVCHQYRMTYPTKLEWAQPGGRGAGADRTVKDSATIKVTKVGSYTVDVTEDIELWYTGGAPNRGWIMNLDEGEHMYLPSPYTTSHHGGGKNWKLQLTYEPQ